MFQLQCRAKIHPIFRYQYYFLFSTTCHMEQPIGCSCFSCQVNTRSEVRLTVVNWLLSIKLWSKKPSNPIFIELNFAWNEKLFVSKLWIIEKPHRCSRKCKKQVCVGSGLSFGNIIAVYIRKKYKNCTYFERILIVLHIYSYF